MNKTEASKRDIIRQRINAAKRKYIMEEMKATFENGLKPVKIIIQTRNIKISENS